MRTQPPPPPPPQRHTHVGEGCLPLEDAAVEIKRPEDMEKDKLVKEAALWEYRRELGRRAAAEGRRIRARRLEPAHQVCNSADLPSAGFHVTCLRILHYMRT